MVPSGLPEVGGQASLFHLRLVLVTKASSVLPGGEEAIWNFEPGFLQRKPARQRLF